MVINLLTTVVKMKKLRKILRRSKLQKASPLMSLKKEEQEGSNSTFEKRCLILRLIQMSRDSLRKTPRLLADGQEMSMKSL